MTSLSLNEIRRGAGTFASDWKDKLGKERQQAPFFVCDLLGVSGITDTRAATYQYRACRSSKGNRGYIALVPCLCLIEMKSADSDLATAEQQAMDHIDDLDQSLPAPYALTSCINSA